MHTQLWERAQSVRSLPKVARATVRLAPWQNGLVALCLLFLAGSLYWQVRTPNPHLLDYDFYSYYTSALDLRHGVNPFAPVAAWIHTYQPGQPFVASYYVYAPFFALLVVPFTFLPFRAAFLLWSLCNGVMLYGSVALLVRTAGVRLAQFQVLLLTLCASLLSMVRLEYNWGQADIFVLFFVCAAFYARQREHSVIAGLLLALACVTKPPLLLFVPFLLWKREFRYAAATTVAFLTMLFMPFLWLGRQAFSDQLLIWQFWSNQYVSFIDNNSPKGVLARLLTINPNVRPLIVAPAVMTILWLAIVVVVSICVLAVITPTPLRRDVYSLLEMGLIILAMFLISPLTEYIYLTLLIVPLCSIYLFTFGPSNNHPHHARRALSIATIVGWLLLCLPLQRIEYFFWPRMQTPSPVAHLYVLLAAIYLYVAVAFFVLQLAALSLALDRTFPASLRRLLAISLRNRMMHTPQDIGADVPEHQTSQETDHTNTGRRSPIRVLLMTNSVAIGGMEKHVEMLARDLSRDAADVYAICPRWEEIAPWAATLAQSIDDAQHFAQITPDRRYGRLSLLKETLHLWQQLRRWRTQVMHLHLTTYEGGFWTLLAARLAGVRAIFCTEHLAPEHPLPRMRKLRRDLITRSLTGVVCVSLKNHRAREQHLYTPPHKTTVVNNGVDLDNFPPTPPLEIADLRAQLGIPPNAPVVGTAVRFVEEKGLPYLLDAMPRVLAAAPGAYLLLVGDGPLRDALAQQAATLGYSDRVIFAGFQADPRPYLSLMNAFVLPVPFGSASIGLLEAMAMRRAVIITFGGEGEAVIDGETGLCPPPRDPQALAEAILRVILHPEFERKLGANARRRIEQSFSSRSAATQLLALYQKAFGSTNHADYRSPQTSLVGVQQEHL